MKLTLLLTFMVLITASCCDKTGRYVIDGHCDKSLDGDTVSLAYSNDGTSLVDFSTAVVSDGKFKFCGSVVGCKVAYMCCRQGEYNVCTMFFLEEGHMTVTMDTAHFVVSGTGYNDMHNRVEDSIRYYIRELEDIEYSFYERELENEELIRLGTKGYNLQKNLISYIRNTINSNMGNMFGLYMLVAYSDLFTNTELKQLIAGIPTSSIDRSNNSLYDVIVAISSERDRYNK